MASYKAAIDWIANEDDTGWLHDDEPIPSVTASMVADLFGKQIEIVITDLRARIKTMAAAS